MYVWQTPPNSMMMPVFIVVDRTDFISKKRKFDVDVVAQGVTMLT